MLKILITLPGASFEYGGDDTLPTVRPLIDQWYGALGDPDGHLRELTADLAGSNTVLVDAETEAAKTK